MLNRRLLRVKVMQTLYTNNCLPDISLNELEKILTHSIHKSYEQYFLYIQLLLEIRNHALKVIEHGKNKKIPSEEDLNPNMRFVDNIAFNILADNERITKYYTDNGCAWNNYPELIKGVYKFVVSSELYTNYMESDDTAVNDDLRFVSKLLEKVIAYYLPLYDNMEEQSIFWNDESEFTLSMASRTIKNINVKSSTIPFESVYKDAEDKEFVIKLLHKTALNADKYYKLIEKYSQNWDADRVAVLDVVIIQMAISELVEFKNIPIKVSVNEYLEIAKHYSTEKSNIYINGILEKAIIKLTDDKEIVKAGRGLIS